MLTRGHGAQAEVMARLSEAVRGVPGVSIYLQPTQDLTIDAETGPTEFRVSLEGADTAVVTEWVGKLMAEMRTRNELRNVTSDAGAQGLAAFIDIDRDTAARLGVTASAIDDAPLQRLRPAHRLDHLHRDQPVPRHPRGAAAACTALPKRSASSYLRTASGEPAPLAAIATITERRAPLQITHVAQYPALDHRLRRGPWRLARRRGRRDPRLGEGGRPAEVGAAHLPRRLGRLRAFAPRTSSG